MLGWSGNPTCLFDGPARLAVTKIDEAALDTMQVHAGFGYKVEHELRDAVASTVYPRYSVV